MELAAFLELLRAEVISVLQRYGEDQSCIAVCALLTHILRRIGYPTAYPLTVRVSIYTRQTHEWIKKHGVPKNDLERMAFNQAGCVHASIGYTPLQMLPPNHWSGHLAVIIPKLFGSRHGLTDFTIVQANRPELGITLTPIVLKVKQDFTAGKAPASCMVRGCFVVYEAFPNDLTFNDRGNWEQSDVLQSLASLVVQSLRAKGAITRTGDVLHR